MEEEYEFECGQGWEKLYKPILDKIEEENKNRDESNKIKILQIKEKFGGLRIYLENETEEIAKMVFDAEDKSYQTCEICGSEENVYTVSHRCWYSTKCLDCIRKRLKDKDSYWKRENIILKKPFAREYYLLDEDLNLILKKNDDTK